MKISFKSFNRKKLAIAALGISMFSIVGWNYPEKETPPTDKNIEEKVEKLLNQMSIEEKVGQMTQVTLDVVLKEGTTDQIDVEKLRKAILEKKVGSILNVGGHAYSMEKWHEIITLVQEIAQETENEIPILYGIDAIHGPTYITGAVLFPHNIGMGATRRPELVKEAAQITAVQTRASGIPWNFDPVLGLGRQPLWSRFEETFGEDVVLVTEMGTAAIRGYEEGDLSGNKTVAACMKHYIGYSLPASGKDRTPAYIPEYILREYLLPPFRAAVEAGVSTAMINSGEVNGVPVHASKYYLTDILRDELGFEGVAVSDWEDVIRLHTRHRVAATPKEAVRLAVEAGLDMSMVPMDYSFYDLLLELVNDGAISEDRLDLSVRRILTLKYKLGLFDDPFPNDDALEELSEEAVRAVALNSARESMTLLKNEQNVLPIAEGSKVLVAGPSANNISSMFSSWSYTWQGADESRYPENILSVKEALINALGAENVVSSAERDYNAEANYDVEQLKTDAEGVDYIVLCLGERAYAEGVGVIDNLQLDEKQLELAEAALATGKKVVLVLVEGRPRTFGSIADRIPGILLAYRPSTMGAQAITDALLGVFSPAGVLPFTYPANSGDIVLYDRKGTEDIREDQPSQYGDGGFRPLFPFGHGLSYTTFAVNDLKVDKTTFETGDEIKISVNVKNTGDRESLKAVELYSRDLYASITPNAKRLRKFKKINLKPGEQKQVEFVIVPGDLAFVNAEGKRVTESGEFELMVGDQKVKVTYEDNGPSRP